MILTVTLNPTIDKIYTVENFQIGEIFRAKDMHMIAAGKGINVARVCYKLNEEVMATGFLGGSAGTFIKSAINKTGIANSFIDIEGETRTSMTIADIKRQTTTQVLEQGPNIPQVKQEEFVQRFSDLLVNSSIVVLSGSLPAGIGSGFYGQLIDIARTRDKKVILDTSGSALKESLEHIPYMIKPNLEELSAITGRELREKRSIADAAYQIHRQGIELVCITLGGDGAIVAYDSHLYSLSIPNIKVINTVGCGDAFVAGCAIGHMRQYTMEDTLKFAMGCGMANTQFIKPGSTDELLVDKFQREISISKLK